MVENLMRRMDRWPVPKFVDSLMEAPDSRSNLTVWGKGVALPVILLLYAVRISLLQSAMFVHLRPFQIIEHHGMAAVAVGGMWLSLACWLHAHFVWSSHERYPGVGQIGEGLGLVMAVTSLLGFLGAHFSDLFRF